MMRVRDPVPSPNPIQSLRTMLHKLIITTLIASTVLVSANESLIQNGTFTKPIAPWKVFSLKDTPGTESGVNDGVLTVKALGASEKPGNRQISQEVAVEAGKAYMLSFDVKGTLETGLEMVVAIVPAPGKFAFFKKVPISTEWTSQKIKITPKEMELAEGAKPILKFLLGNLKGDISFRNVTLVPVQ